MEPEYAVTVYIAAPATSTPTGRSTAGHMWYEVHKSTGSDVNSVSNGFAPIEHGSASGPGEVFHNDTNNYQYNQYQRTVKITETQYKTMSNFAVNPTAYGFSTEYNGGTNSCIDFTWKGLEEAGLLKNSEKGYDGSLLPLDNIEQIERRMKGEAIENPNKKGASKKKTANQRLKEFAGETWDDIENLFSQSNQPLGAGKQSILVAISNVPSFNYTNSKRSRVRGFTLIQTLDNAANPANSTTFNGQPAYLLAQTNQPTCTGDEAGWAGGVKSGTVGGTVKPTSGSSSILVEGRQLVREGDSCTMNNANTTGKYTRA